jgi:hypothetical protein
MLRDLNWIHQRICSGALKQKGEYVAVVDHVSSDSGAAERSLEDRWF